MRQRTRLATLVLAALTTGTTTTCTDCGTGSMMLDPIVGFVAGSVTGAEGFGTVLFRISSSDVCGESELMSPGRATSIAGPGDFVTLLEVGGPDPVERCVRAIVTIGGQERVDSAQGQLWFGLEPADTLYLELERPSGSDMR